MNSEKKSRIDISTYDAENGESTMEAQKIITDHNLQEIFEYPKLELPLIVWKDNYELFADCCVSAHWHSDFEIALLLSGELDYYLSNNHIHLKKGDCVFVNSNSLHMATQKSKEPAVMIGITFKPTALYSELNKHLYSKFFQGITNSKMRGFQIDTTTITGEKIVNNIVEIESLDIKDECYELLCLSVISRIWYEILLYLKENNESIVSVISNQKQEDIVKQIISYIKIHYMDDIPINKIANYVGISRSECFKCFKQYAARTPADYIIEYRLSSAANMHKSTDDSVLEICNKCGFSNSSYFGKRFKKRYGVTPLAFRKRTELI